MSDNPKELLESFLQDWGLKMIEYFQFGEKKESEPFCCIVEAEKR